MGDNGPTRNHESVECKIPTAILRQFLSTLAEMQTGLQCLIDELEESHERIERQRETVERRNATRSLSDAATELNGRLNAFTVSS